MSEEATYSSGRPRRTRQSVSYANNSATPKTVTPNPYKKPTYLAGRAAEPEEDSPDEAEEPANEKSTSRKSTPGRRGRPSRRGSAASATKAESTKVIETPPATPKSSRGGKRGSTAANRGGASGSSSRKATTGWNSKTRPECVATRSDRKSTSKSKKRKRGYNSHDYHYGSDFESDDQNDSDPDPVPSESDKESEEENDVPMDETLLESDSDVSGESSTRQRLPSPPVPVWMEPEQEVEELEVPRSSDDLLLSREYVMEAVSIYEPLRRFQNLVRLTPFRFEDFCAALASEEQSPLLVEIHIQLLKSLLREDEINGTVYGPNECKDSIQSVIFFMDNLTWAESLRSYVESDPAWSEIADLLSSVEYPFCSPSIRIKILTWLVDGFLLNNSVRESLTNEGQILHEDYCRHCNRLGELICCETCPAVYHLGCISGSQASVAPTDDWICPVCTHHQLTAGISDCTSEIEKAGLLLRHEKLGYDRHGRQYWFLVRRILIESEDRKEVWYYSTRLQVEELLHRLDAEKYESFLVENILYFRDEIYRQMAITEKITAAMNIQHRKTYLEAENAFLSRIHEEREQINKQAEEEKARIEEEARQAKKKEEEEKLRLEEEARKKKEDEKRRIREERLAKRNQIKAKNRNALPGDEMDVLDASLLNDESKDSLFDHEETVESSDTSKDKPTENVVSEAQTQPLENGEAKDEHSVSINDELTQKVVPNEDSKSVEVSDKPAADASPANVESSETPSNGNGESKTEETLNSEQKTEAKADVVISSPAPAPASSILPKIFAKSKSLNLEVDSEDRMTRLKSTGLYKLGQEGGFRHYVNSYSSDPLALSKIQHGEERDKRRMMSHKFSLTPASECKWIGVQHGFRTSIVSTVRATLLQMENAIPMTLMHCNWNLLRKAWIAGVQASSTSKELTKALLMLVCCLRPCVFNPIWSESTGHVKLLRTTAAEREHRKKIEKRDKKDRDDEEDRLRLLPQFVKYSIPAKHQVWKQKGEEFRLHGRWGWIWLSGLRPAKPVDCRTKGLLNGPHKHVVQVKGDDGKVKTMLIDPSVFGKLMAKRSKKASTETQPEESKTAKASDASKPEESEAKPAAAAEADAKKADEAKPAEVAELLDNEKSKPSESSNVNLPEVLKSTEATSEPMEVDQVKVESSAEVKLEVEEEIKLEPTDVKLSADPSEVLTINDESVTEAKAEPGSEPMEVDSVEVKSEKDDADSEMSSAAISEVKPVEAEVKDSTASSPAEEAKPATDPVTKPDAVKEEPEIEVINVIPGKPKVATPQAKDKPTTPDNNPFHAARKFRTELINVSLGIVSANRILFPKVAHAIPLLDSLLARRLKWQTVEENVLAEKYGKEYLESLNLPPKELPKIKVEMDDSFPLAGGYSYGCYSHECQTEARANNPNYEARCYSPMCRLKFVMLDARRRKLERERQLEIEKNNKLRAEVEAQRVYTKSKSSAPIYLKNLPEAEPVKKREIIKHPVASKFCSNVSKKPSILILPRHELRKLARTAGRCNLPAGYTVNSKPNSWIWPYPCGRPFFKTSWQYRTVHASGLGAAAMQLRILFASVRWDDIQMKPPTADGKSQITTDMEIITSEILNHRIVGRFDEIFQYLRKRHIVPIDAPKTIREVTPSRSGLRKRKRAESPDKTEPTIKEEWVDEDKLEVWEIRYYGDKLEKKVEKKPETPLGSTRTKSGISLQKPEKFDPSPKESSTPKAVASPAVEPKTKTKIVIEKPIAPKEPVETEMKIQRAVHLSKRDNHAKTNNNTQNKVPTPTASQQVKQNAAAAANNGNPPKTFVHLSQTPTGGKKFFVTKPATTVGARLPGTPGAVKPGDPNAGILSRKPVPAKGGSNAIQQLQIASPTTSQQLKNQKLQVFRTSDGKLQVKGLLPGQHAYQTADGKVHVIAAPPGSQLLAQSKGGDQANNIQTVTAVTSPGLTNALAAITQAYANANNPPTPTVAISQPLVNISNPAIKTVISTTPSTSASVPRQPPPLATSTTPRVRKVPIRVAAPAPAPLVPQPHSVNIGLSAAQLLASNVPIRIQTQKGVFEISPDQIQINNGVHQIVLGHGLPVINLASSTTPVTLPLATQVRPAALVTSGSSPAATTAVPLGTAAGPVSTTPAGNQPVGTQAGSTTNPPALTATVPHPQPVITATSPFSKFLYEDGGKTYMVNTIGLTIPQAQIIAYQLQQKKLTVKNAAGQPIGQIQLPKGFQPANQTIQAQQVQVVQQAMLSSSQPEPPKTVVPAPVTAPEGQAGTGTPVPSGVQQPPDQPIFQSPGQPSATAATTLATQGTPTRPAVTPTGVQQVAAVGGHRIYVNRFMRPLSTATSGASHVSLSVGGGMTVRPGTPQQHLVPKLVTGTEMSTTKTLISVEGPKYVPGSPSTASGIAVSTSTHTPPTVTRTPGLPISIVSPAKPKALPQGTHMVSLQRPASQPPPLTASTSDGSQPNQLGIMTSQQLTGVLQQQQQPQVRPQQVQLVSSGGQQLQQAQIVTTPSGQQQIQILTPSGPQAIKFIPGQSQQIQIVGQNQTIIGIQNRPRIGILSANAPMQQALASGSPQQHRFLARTGSVIPTSILPTTLLKQQQQLMAASGSSAQVQAKQAGNFVGQIIQSPRGPSMVIQGLSGSQSLSLTPQQLAQLQSQLNKPKGPVFLASSPNPSAPLTPSILQRAVPGAAAAASVASARTPPARKSPTKITVTKPKTTVPLKPNADQKSIDESIEAVIGLAAATSGAETPKPPPTAPAEPVIENFKLQTPPPKPPVSTPTPPPVVATKRPSEDKNKAGVGKGAVAKKRKTSESVKTGSDGTPLMSPPPKVISPTTQFPTPTVAHSKPSPVRIQSSEMPRFVLSQDLVELSAPSLPTTSSDHQSPLSPVSSWSNPQVPELSDKILNVTPPFPNATPVKTSRRKSPVRSDSQHAPFSPTKLNNPMSNHKILTVLYKHKELLKKDMTKKRLLMEKDCTMELQEEISNELDKQASSITTTPMIPSQKRRKLSESSKPKPKSNPSPKSKPKRKSPGKKGQKKNELLYCLCKTPYDNTRFYVGCDKCSNWYHGECIGISEELSKCLSDYICDSCQNPKENDGKEKETKEKQYCLCKQPYDEAQFYIACDSCEDWFHGRCVGILESESGEIDVYTCPNCNPGTPLNIANLVAISASEYPMLIKLFKQIQAHKSSWPFLEPVDAADAPNYFTMIKEPMDLQTIESRMDSKSYARLRDFISDITKIFENCRYYNPPGSNVVKCANILEAFFVQKIKLFRQKLIEAHSASKSVGKV